MPERLLAQSFENLRTRWMRHWPEYLIEALGLCAFMLCAASFAALLEYPGSPVRQAIDDPFVRRALMGIAMGSTAVAIVYSPWGRRSGAHINPVVTLTFLRLGKVRPIDALGYVLAQFTGGLIGILVAAALIPAFLAHPEVHYVATVPGVHGRALAFVAEAVISFLLMLVVLRVSSTPRLKSFTGLCAGALVALYITLEAPLSGMSMNPARTFGSAWPAQEWNGLWIYFTAPPLGMLLAAEAHLRLFERRAHCAKLQHDDHARCIFCGETEAAR